jgi:hypothetical protein
MLLGLAGLTLMWFACSTGSAQPRPVPQLPSSVTGHGEAVETAKKVALAKAVQEIKETMKRNEMSSFEVTEDYVRNNVLVDSGQPGKDVKVDNIADPFKAWVVNFRPDADWWHDLERRDQEAERKIRSEQRQTLGSRLIIGLAFVLLAGFGYVRLDEYTQRRYTTWLRVAGLGVATTAVAGWWWIVFQAPG